MKPMVSAQRPVTIIMPAVVRLRPKRSESKPPSRQPAAPGGYGEECQQRGQRRRGPLLRLERGAHIGDQPGPHGVELPHVAEIADIDQHQRAVAQDRADPARFEDSLAERIRPLAGEPEQHRAREGGSGRTRAPRAASRTSRPAPGTDAAARIRASARRSRRRAPPGRARTMWIRATRPADRRRPARRRSRCARRRRQLAPAAAGAWHWPSPPRAPRSPSAG